MADLKNLYVRRAELTEQLIKVNEAIQLQEVGKPVKIRTGKNIRNTGGLTTWTNDSFLQEGTAVLVFEDQDLTRPAKEFQHDGWISAESAAKIKSGEIRTYGVELIEE